MNDGSISRLLQLFVSLGEGNGGWRPVIDLSPQNAHSFDDIQAGDASVCMFSTRKDDFMDPLDFKDAYSQVLIH